MFGRLDTVNNFHLNLLEGQGSLQLKFDLIYIPLRNYYWLAEAYVAADKIPYPI